MIASLKRKFILLAAVMLFLLLSLIVTGMNLLNFKTLSHTADETLDLLVESEEHFSLRDSLLPSRIPDVFSAPAQSPELFYESRYFSVFVSAQGQVLNVKTDQIAAVDESLAIDYADRVLRSGKTRGFLDCYRYVCTLQEEGVRITFLDRTRELDQARQFLLTSILIAAVGFVWVFLLLFFVAGQIVRPIADNYEKQKRFITDAGHEIRTPLSIIRTNVDVLELEEGENECLQDIRRQTERMSELTEDLILLARAEEKRDTQQIDFPLSEVVEAAASEFALTARARNKPIVCSVEPMLTLRGDARDFTRLVGLLLTNALKYSPENTQIRLWLFRRAKTISLVVENETQFSFSEEELVNIFERFYRPDPSRTSATGGHGIGLSVARAITQAAGGKITAEQPAPGLFRISAVFVQ